MENFNRGCDVSSLNFSNSTPFSNINFMFFLRFLRQNDNSSIISDMLLKNVKNSNSSLPGLR
jgi:hypothetical protein